MNLAPVYGGFDFIIFFPISICVLEMIWEKYGLKIDRSWSELFANSGIYIFFAVWNALLVYFFQLKEGHVISGVMARASENFRLFEIQYGVWQWIVCFLLVELLYYLNHRIAHSHPFLFIEHSIHHSSHEFNMSTSLRISWWMILYLGFVYAPAAMIGFPVGMVGSCVIATWFWQHLIHFDRCPRLGILEWVFNTPSHHRVHHISSHKYMHHNFGGALIIWDRLLGTFLEEKLAENRGYGVGMKVTSKNPFWLQTVYISEYLKNIRARSIKKF